MNVLPAFSCYFVTSFKDTRNPSLYTSYSYKSISLWYLIIAPTTPSDHIFFIYYPIVLSLLLTWRPHLKKSNSIFFSLLDVFLLQKYSSSRYINVGFLTLPRQPSNIRSLQELYLITFSNAPVVYLLLDSLAYIFSIALLAEFKGNTGELSDLLMMWSFRGFNAAFQSFTTGGYYC